MMNPLTDENAERTALGCALSDSDVVYRLLPLLQAQDFALDSHRRIFGVIAELGAVGKPVDELTVTDLLIEKGQLESVGGVGYVSALTQNVDAGLARVMNVEHYARMILDKSRRRQVLAAATAVAAATEDPGVTTDECLERIQESLLRVEAASGKTTARHVKEILPETIHELEAQASNQGGLVGMSTGIPSLDRATGGIRRGELWTIGALPGRGKSALGAQFVLANGVAGIPTLDFSIEMADLEICKRFLAAKSTVSATQLRNPRMINAEGWRNISATVDKIREWPIYVDPRPSVKIQELLATARLYIRRHAVQLIVVDYLRLVEAPGRELRERVGYVANALRQLAKSECVGVVLLSQLRRPDGGINAKPSMLDLKESGDIEAHSHVVLLPYLPVDDNNQPIPEKQLLIIGKNRNGSVGDKPIRFDLERLQFFDRTPEQPPPPQQNYRDYTDTESE